MIAYAATILMTFLGGYAVADSNWRAALGAALGVIAVNVAELDNEEEEEEA